MSLAGNMKKYNNSKDLLNEEQQTILRNKTAKIEQLTKDITQLSQPLLKTEGSAQWSRHVTPNTLSLFPDERSWNSIENVNMNKHSNSKEFKDMSGLSWNTMRDSMHLDSEEDSCSDTSSPLTTRLDANDMSIYGSMPMEDEMVVVKCNYCNKPILASQFRVHLGHCIGDIKTETDEDKDIKSLFTDEEELENKDIKIESEETDQKKETKEKDKDIRKKSVKQKAPLDLDKQCGVIQGPNNLPCTRSLTCKSHSMGSKRAVEGRSQAYDVLLAAYQKKAIGRPTGKEIIKKKVAGKSIKNLIKLQQNQLGSPVSSLNGSPISSTHHPPSRHPMISLNHRQSDEDAFVDSDEEVKHIMQSLKTSHPQPLADRPYYFVKRRRHCYRLRDILLNVITPKSPLTDDTAVISDRQSISSPIRPSYTTHNHHPNNTAANTLLTKPTGFNEPNSPSSVHTSFSVR